MLINCYEYISALHLVVCAVFPVITGNLTQNALIIFMLSAVCLLIDTQVEIDIDILIEIKLLMILIIDTMICRRSAYLQALHILGIGFLISAMSMNIHVARGFTIGCMLVLALTHVVQRKYQRLLSINNFSVISLIVILNHKMFFVVAMYGMVYCVAVHGYIPTLAYQYNYSALRESHRQNLKNIIQLLQSKHLPTRHRMINYLTLLLQQPITNVPKQITKELRQLSKLYQFPTYTTTIEKDLLKFIENNQYYLYSKIAAPTHYGMYIRQQQSLLKLNQDKEQIDKIQHILLIDLILADIENTDIIIERNKKRPQETFEVFNEPQFAIPEAQILEGQQNVMKLVRNSSTGMLIEHGDIASPSGPGQGTSMPTKTQTSSGNATPYADVEKRSLKNGDKSSEINFEKRAVSEKTIPPNLQVITEAPPSNSKEVPQVIPKQNNQNSMEANPAESCFFANRYPSELNVSNYPRYFQITPEQQSFKQQLDETYEEWHKNVPSNPLSEYVCDQFESLDFDSTEFNQLTNQRPLAAITYLAVRKLKFDQVFSLNMQNFFYFLCILEDSYNCCLYHNKLHAADVVQCTYLLIQQDRRLAQQKEFFQQLDSLALLMAAACHDFGHSGVDNPFLHKYCAKLHQVFPEVGPLEQIHAALSFNLIIKCNFLEENLRLFRIKFVEFILTTDMTSHFQFVSKMKNISDSFILAYRDNQIQEADALSHLRWLRMKIVVKIADISNPCRPFKIAQYWAYAFVNENRAIGALGAPVNAAQDFTKHSIIDCQIGFINFVLKPFIDEIKRFCGTTSAVELQMHQNMLNALQRWQQRKQEQWAP